MNAFIRYRDKIRKLILSREMLFMRIWHGIIALVGLLCIKNNFGYQKTISQLWVSILVAVVCAFLPVQGVAMVLMLMLLVDLFTLSAEVAIVAFIFIVVGYLLCAYFHSKNTYNLAMVPVCYCFNAPYAMALGTGLMCNINELVSILCGTITSYYLHIIKLNATSILDESSTVSVTALLTEQMLKNRAFYFYLAAMLAMYLLVYYLRMSNIRMSWLVADAAGALVEFIIMLTGFLLTNQRDQILGLAIGNLIVLAVGFILNYFILDLDYSRIEKVQFEDDDYYYYVTAVPKIRIVEEEKEVKTFTRPRSKQR